MSWIFEYLLFLAKSITIVAAIAGVLLFIVSLRKRAPAGSLEVKDISENYTELKEMMQYSSMNDAEAKVWEKQQKKQRKLEKKQEKLEAKKASKEEVSESTTDSAEAKKSTQEKSKLYVLSFNGSMDAKEVEDLRQEVTAVLSVIKPEDKVALKLESPGGVVHGYGLAASQLMRFKQHNVELIALVDKVAASGGYMMACTASKIIAAPFAIIGSIGVVAQIPNFHRLLKKNDIDVELQTAGEYKRTLTLFGENTDEGRKKFQEELNETHLLFKDFVRENRPNVDIDAVATGEHWFATQAKDKGLVDEIGTSDDYILSHLENYKILSVKYRRNKKLSERVANQVTKGVERVLFRRQF
ncbi:protease SohB [Zophobihabitans entericus]|uniref:Protease SohB n=1 Tax=Zophobihabitans entericus TaxID=1635327 RepID=A0A6G9I7V9_9GAMM|nr:protease SohB [Zophobihabitans entericus]QIQ20291.1 protease SohB [Zophobihabitans entericus]